MSQSAVVPEQVCLQQPFELSETVTLVISSTQVWSSRCVTPIAEGVVWPSNSAHRRVGRAESAHADVSDELTVVCQVRRCIAGQTLEDQDSDLELDSLSHGQPVQLPYYQHDVITAPRTSYRSHDGTAARHT